MLCPSFTALAAVSAALEGSAIRLGAQDAHHESHGAYTGEVSIGMLRDAGCSHVIVGHSERRALFGETDESVRSKTAAALAAGVQPIVCVGETLEQRKREATAEVVRAQVTAALRGLGGSLAEVIVAYEPVWAIGTGRNATAAQVQAVHAVIRRTLAGIATASLAEQVRIQYGGSVKPENAGELFAGADVDGGLIGGASLDASSFAAIVRAAA